MTFVDYKKPEKHLYSFYNEKVVCTCGWENDCEESNVAYIKHRLHIAGLKELLLAGAFGQ